MGAERSSDFAEYFRFNVPLMRSRQSGSCADISLDAAVSPPKTETSGGDIAHHFGGDCIVINSQSVVCVCVCVCVCVLVCVIMRNL